MSTGFPPLKGAAFSFTTGLVAQAATPPDLFQANPTIAAGDFKVSKDGGALANLTTLPVVAPAGSKILKISLSATEMTADNVTVIGSDAAGAEWSDVLFSIQTSAGQTGDNVTIATGGIDNVLTTDTRFHMLIKS